MSLCGCSNFDYDTDGWRYEYPRPVDDFTKLDTNKRKRCCSCKELIEIGADCVKLNMARSPRHEIEENIYGDDGEIPMADWYMCDDCGGKFLSLFGLGDMCLS